MFAPFSANTYKHTNETFKKIGKQMPKQQLILFIYIPCDTFSRFMTKYETGFVNIPDGGTFFRLKDYTLKGIKVLVYVCFVHAVMAQC
jgi:hypothetical protein